MYDHNQLTVLNELDTNDSSPDIQPIETNGRIHLRQSILISRSRHIDSRRIEILAAALNVLGHFDSPHPDRPTAA